MTGPFIKDSAAVAASLARAIRSQVLWTLRRKGAVIAVSGGIDSAVSAALCVKALGKDRVVLLSLPEEHSSPTSLELARELAASLDVPLVVEDVTATLRACGCYDRQAEAIRRVIPDYRDGDVFKIVLPSPLDSARLSIPRLVVRSGDGTVRSSRIPRDAYFQLKAATNFKQRTRMMVVYYYAERHGYAVCGTPNRLEYDQGFFVRGGDGVADFKPIAHLYKTDVYLLAGELGVPDSIRTRTPTTDTFPMEQSQDEFFFGLGHEHLDWCLFGVNNHLPAGAIAEKIGIPADQVKRVYDDILSKRRAAVHLHRPALMVEPVPEVDGHDPIPEPDGDARVNEAQTGGR